MADQWEYRTLAGMSREKLSELGREGWELCGVLPGDTSAPLCEFHTPPTYHFKRRIVATPDLKATP